MQFKVNKNKKRAATLAVITETKGGKIAVWFTLFLAAMTVVLPALILIFEEKGLTDDGPAMDALLVLTVFLSGTIMSAGGTYRQRTAFVAMRSKERMEIRDDGILRYSFRVSGNSSRESRNVILINLHYVESVLPSPVTGNLSFTGGVRGHYYKNVKAEPMLTWEEMEELNIVEIGNYFDPDLRSVIQTTWNVPVA